MSLGTFEDPVLLLLKRRDASCTSLSNFCKDYQKAVEQVVKLERERSSLQNEKEALLLKIGVSDVKTSVEMDQKLKELEEKANTLQSQLTDAYKKNGDNVEKMLAALSAQRQADQVAQEKETEAAKWKEKADEARATADRLEKEVKERDVQILTIKDEVQAVQARLVEREKKLKEIEEENAVLIERWLHFKNQEAEQLNKQNTILTEQVQVQKAKEKEELMGQAKSIMDPEKKSSPSLLDGGGAIGSFVAVKLPTHARKEISAHQGEANCVSFSSSGEKFCTGGADTRIKLWDSRSGSLLTQLSGSVGSVMSATWSINEQYILGCACDNSARVWDVHMGRLKHTLTGHIGKVYGGVFSSDTLKAVTGAHDRTIKIWDMNTGNTVKTIFCFSSCNGVCISEAYSCIASAHLDGVLRLWDLRTGEATQEYKDAHTKQITCVVPSPTEPTLLTSSRDNLLKIWDLRKGECILTLRDDAFRSGLNWSRACWSPDGKYAAAGGAEGSLFIWDTIENGNLVKQLGSESSATISCVSWNPTGHQVASTDRKSKLVLWE